MTYNSGEQTDVLSLSENFRADANSFNRRLIPARVYDFRVNETFRIAHRANADELPPSRLNLHTGVYYSINFILPVELSSVAGESAERRRGGRGGGREEGRERALNVGFTAPLTIPDLRS